MRFRLLILALLVSVTATGQSARPFRDGERFTMSLMFKWGAVNTEVAQADIRLDSLLYRDESAYHVNCFVKTAPFFEVFFKMREDFHSWFRTSDLRPLKFTRDTYEGGYTATNLYLYDWPAGVIHANVNFEGKGPQVLDIPLHEGVFDLPSLIYYFRTLDMDSFSRGDRFPFTFAIDDDVYDIVLTYYGKERLNVRKKGKMDAVHFSCSVVTGAMFEGNQEVQMWFSDDARRIPLAIMVPLRWGSIRGWIKDYQP